MYQSLRGTGPIVNTVASFSHEFYRRIQSVEWLLKSIPNDLNVLHVPSGCGLLSARELEITETVDINTTLTNLAQGVWSSVEVTTAYSKRAIIAHQLTNCLTEIFVDKALARAKELDEHLARTGKVVGPLHGLPLSLKDTFPIKGLVTSMGYVAWLKEVAENDCVIVEILKDAGAVLFVRTNAPQTLMWGETYNNIFGRTLNPYNRSLTPGGSSGGEGALIALRGSPLGVGTDIGGSVRIPTTFTSLYALRSSMFRFPYSRVVNSFEGQEAIQSVLGPMAPSLAALRLFAKTVVDSKPWNLDPACPRLPWNAEYEALSDHGGPGPNLKRALEITRKALRAAGHIVLDWENHRHMDIHRNAHAIYFGDAAIDVPMERHVVIPPVAEPESALFDSQEEPAAMGPPWGIPGKTAGELWDLHKERRKLMKEYLDQWEATTSKTGTGRPVDAIISPAAAYPAPPHGHNSDAFYTSLWNTLDYSAVTFPVTTVDPALDVKVHRDVFHNHEDEHVYHWYDPHLFKDAPVGLQVVGRPYEEEAVLTMTSIVIDALVRDH
ncbi:hypothetical protein BS47DRAFT_1372763 [Hydnum rufescens UP504]|uniref:amidase n=1 Tax=Hydnum rufescens UP504 TaxID=1448309 RepID=A0A9P6DVE4_9AGAM|nr:hypothetical protein BS47DRAFT_1372763 [Hydnum rufescens UP504]